ncbi:IS66 family insertion sequence hypothetical protein [Pontibacter diazotrophicus]|uniref:Transposase n=1 Tax=Pontibacter diazotrophicus TaxID=1400979 RepID=A0A3D8KY66_9BACT|nr:IS66 family insertion sequence hypothetical protein [Pontibacter diazotrophicus]
MVTSELGRSSTGGEVFVFLNRKRTRLEMLHWEHGGFVLYYKRLALGTFPLPKATVGSSLSWSDLILMV